MKYKIVLALLLLSIAVQAPAMAASTSRPLSITVRQNLAVVFTPAAPIIDCTTPAGTIVSALSVTGGNGKPVTYAITGGDTADFALTGTNVVVGVNGIALTTCGTVANVTVTATQ